MILFQKLEWDNFFSYGESNSINLSEYPVVQLLGKNGAGKTSIALIIQEVLFGKTTKKITKSSLINRNTNKARAILWFSVHNHEYKVIYERSSSKLSLKLFKDGEDISSHTSPNTYKKIQEIIGMDSDVGLQLLYQSSKTSLQFLTATDTQRKKFLVKLFDLDKYLEYQKKIKAAQTEFTSKLDSLSGSIASTKEWLAQNKNVNIKFKELLPVVDNSEVIDSITSRVTDLRVKLAMHEREVKEVAKNNALREQLGTVDTELAKLDILPIPAQPECIKTIPDLSADLRNHKKKLKELKEKRSKCPTCGQPIDISNYLRLIPVVEKEIQQLESNIEELTKIKVEYEAEVSNTQVRNSKIKKERDLLESILAEYDESMPTEVPSIDSIEEHITELNEQLKELRAEEIRVKTYNEEAKAHNAKMELLHKQLNDLIRKLVVLERDFSEVQEKVDILKTLADTFSTNGIISHKLKYLSKDLEDTINHYLSELSRGRFQIYFKLSGDKLNIEMLDTDIPITISELSEGELAKVSVSTLLAIRKMMQVLSNTKFNLLFLDEVMGVLDYNGKDDLIEILNKETKLNTFLVSHEYSHPLVPKLQVSKDKHGISTIEEA